MMSLSFSDFRESILHVTTSKDQENFFRNHIHPSIVRFFYNVAVKLSDSDKYSIGLSNKVSSKLSRKSQFLLGGTKFFAELSKGY